MKQTVHTAGRARIAAWVLLRVVAVALLAAWLEPLRKPLRDPLLFEEGPAPGTPRTNAWFVPDACLTTLPPRCCVMVVKQSSGTDQTQRGVPGAGTAAIGCPGSGGEDRKNQTTTAAKPEADNRGLRLGECAGSRNVIASRSVNALRSVRARSSLQPSRRVPRSAGGLGCAGWRSVIASRSMHAARAVAARTQLATLAVGGGDERRVRGSGATVAAGPWVARPGGGVAA